MLAVKIVGGAVAVWFLFGLLFGIELATANAFEGPTDRKYWKTVILYGPIIALVILKRGAK